MRQRYSLTILTVIADLEFNGFLQFQRLKIFYLESFSLSKVFIFFGVVREGANTLARFLQGDDNGDGNLNDNRNLDGYDNLDGNIYEKNNRFSFLILLAIFT